MRVTLLGCGSSGGVPLIGNNWGDCDPQNPRNRRRRPSVLVESGGRRILVDTAPDLREQLLAAEVATLDAVLYTHDHADHVMGIDDLRIVRRHTKRDIDVWAAPEVLARLTRRFEYLFVGHAEPDPMYRPIMVPHAIEGPFSVGGIGVVPFAQEHGTCRTLGFRFGRFAYSTDVVDFPEESFAALEGVELWIVDALRDGAPHPTHANLGVALEWIDRVKPRRAVLTHMNHQADYETLRSRLPQGVEPGYDGMVLELADG